MDSKSKKLRTRILVFVHKICILLEEAQRVVFENLIHVVKHFYELEKYCPAYKLGHWIFKILEDIRNKLICSLSLIFFFFLHLNLFSCVWLFATPWTIQSMNFPGQNTGVGGLSLFQGIFPTQGSNPGLHIADRFFTSWAAREAQEYWSGWPIPSPGDLPDPGIEQGSPVLQADSLPTELSGKPHGYFQSLW